MSGQVCKLYYSFLLICNSAKVAITVSKDDATSVAVRRATNFPSAPWYVKRQLLRDH